MIKVEEKIILAYVNKVKPTDQKLICCVSVFYGAFLYTNIIRFFTQVFRIIRKKKSMIFYLKYFYTINFVWPTALCDRIECYVLTKMKTQNHKKTTPVAHQTRT